MDPGDLAALLFGDEPSGEAKAKALARSIGGQQQAGLLGLLTGDKVLGGVGQKLLSGAQEQQDLLPKAADMRLRRTLESQREAAALQAKSLGRGESQAELDAARAALGKEMGIDASGLSMAGIEALRKTREGNANRSARAATLAQGEEGLGLRRKKLGLSETHLARETSQSTTAGFEPDPTSGGRIMQQGEATKLGEEVAARDKIDKVVDEMKEIIGRHGGTVPWNPASEDYGLLMQKYAELKPLGTTSSGMGNFTQGHDHVISTALGDPSSLSNLTRSGRFSTLLDSFRNSAHHAVEFSAKSKGQRAASAPGAAGRTPVPPGLNLEKSATTKVVGGKTYTLGPNGWEVDE